MQNAVENLEPPTTSFANDVAYRIPHTAYYLLFNLVKSPGRQAEIHPIVRGYHDYICVSI